MIEKVDDTSQEVKNLIDLIRSDSEYASQLKITLARHSFLMYCLLVYPDFQSPPFIRQIIKALGEIESGTIKRLMIAVPPRHGKSTLIDQLFPTWFIGRNPKRQVILCSYGDSLSRYWSVRARDVVASAVYQDIFKLNVDMSYASQADWKVRGAEGEGWEGGIRAAGIGTGITGRGAHLLVIDDPVKDAETARSEKILKDHWDWYTSTSRTRLEPGGAIVLCQTRWSMQDLTGRLLEQEAKGGDKWVKINIPALDSEGNVPWPERFNAKELLEIRELSPYVWEALYQQNPVPVEGMLFQTDWFSVVPNAPPLVKYCRFWDIAAKIKETSDYTVGALIGEDQDGQRYIIDILRGRWTYPDCKELILQTGVSDPSGTQIGIEDTSSGIALLQDLKVHPTGRHLGINPVKVTVDKLVRASPWAASARLGGVKLLVGSWNKEFLDEIAFFPMGRHDDQIDAISGCWELLRYKSKSAMFLPSESIGMDQTIVHGISPQNDPFFKLSPELQDHVAKILKERTRFV